MQRQLIQLGVAGLLAALALACDSTSGSSTSSATASFDRDALLTRFVDALLLPELETFVGASETLETATQALDAAAGADRAEAQAAFGTAMDSWQRLELWRVGPAGEPDMFSGGQSLRDNIYAWPTVNPCRVDQLTAASPETDAAALEGELVNAIGLDALEYLLFVDSDANTCPAQALPNSDGSWDSFDSATLAARRASLASVTASRLTLDARALRDAWTGGFRSDFLESGEFIQSQQQALDELFAALYYLESKTRDMKLSEPSGVSQDCGGETCPERVESPYAERGLRNVRLNLEAFRDSFNGASDGNDYAFDDALRDAGSTELVTSINAAIDAALTRTDALADPLAEAVVNDTEAVRGLVEDVRTIVTLLETQFVGVLGLRVPQEGAADND